MGQYYITKSQTVRHKSYMWVNITSQNRRRYVTNRTCASILHHKIADGTSQIVHMGQYYTTKSQTVRNKAYIWVNITSQNRRRYATKHTCESILHHKIAEDTPQSIHVGQYYITKSQTVRHEAYMWVNITSCIPVDVHNL